DGSKPDPLTGNLPRIYTRPSFMTYLEDALPSLISDAKTLMHGATELVNERNRTAMTRTLQHVAQIAENSETTMRQVNRLLSDENIAALSSVAKEAAPLMRDTRQAAQELSQTVAQVNGLLTDTQSSVGGGRLVLRASQTLDSLTDTAEQATRMLDRLEAAPQSLVFGPPPPVPGPGEPGFSAAAKP
ncbi:MAG: hypothetical protein LBL69_06335, partial [Zoogloeaceae bacterium]|nr:hypothetical protein [Zoogloeaceae bacterium]